MRKDFAVNNFSASTSWLSYPMQVPTFDNTVSFQSNYRLKELLESLDKEGQIGDYSDLIAVHKQIQAARLCLYEIIQQQDNLECLLLKAQEEYSRAHNRVYMDSEGTEKVKNTIADIKTEKLFNTVVQLRGKLGFLNRHATFIRDDLRLLETLSNDYRLMARNASNL